VRKTLATTTNAEIEEDDDRVGEEERRGAGAGDGAVKR